MKSIVHFSVCLKEVKLCDDDDDDDMRITSHILIAISTIDLVFIAYVLSKVGVVKGRKLSYVG
jgi:hypothetical protein